MDKNDSVVIIGAARTPVGAFLGDLKTVPVEELGRIAITEAIGRSGVNKEEIDEVIVGHVTGSQTTNNLARIISINSGLSESSTALTLNRICGSGIQSAISAARILKLDEADFVAAGGAESLSRAEYYLPASLRWEGLRMGDSIMIDANDEGHRTASGYPNKDITHMAITAELLVEKYNIPREELDAFAYDSQMKAKTAVESGRFAYEIVAVEVPGRRGQVTVVDKDGHPKPDTTLEGLAKLRPVFKKDGAITAGNASGLNDGAAFEILTRESIAKERNLEIMAEVIDYSIIGCDPRLMGLGPVKPIQALLKRNNFSLEDIDVLEINEAFAAQMVACMIELGFDRNSDIYKNALNPNGGAVALGHPLGMSGARIITSICYEFKKHPEKKYGIASACIGGGQGIALLLKNRYS